MSEDAVIYFVVQGIAWWENLAIGVLEVGRRQEGSIGFMPVFETWEAAEVYRNLYNPQAKIAAIMEMTGVEAVL